MLFTGVCKSDKSEIIYLPLNAEEHKQHKHKPCINKVALPFTFYNFGRPFFCSHNVTKDTDSDSYLIHKVVRVLTSHQCGPGSIPGSGVMWVEYVVGSRLAARVFLLVHNLMCALNGAGGGGYYFKYMYHLQEIYHEYWAEIQDKR